MPTTHVLITQKILWHLNKVMGPLLWGLPTNYLNEPPIFFLFFERVPLCELSLGKFVPIDCALPLHYSLSNLCALRNYVKVFPFLEYLILPPFQSGSKKGIKPRVALHHNRIHVRLSTFETPWWSIRTNPSHTSHSESTRSRSNSRLLGKVVILDLHLD